MRLCRNSEKTQSVSKRNRQTDEKALGRKPLNGKPQKPQYHGNTGFQAPGHLPILFKNAPRSKALEPVCLFRPPLPPIVTQSL